MKRNDVILIGGILVLALVTILLIQLTKTSGNQVVITVDKKEYKTLDLDKNTSLLIEDEDGDSNYVMVNNGYVSMKSANCPDQLCVFQNSIHFNGETIVCLPHKVVITITSDEESDVDSIAY